VPTRRCDQSTGTFGFYDWRTILFRPGITLKKHKTNKQTNKQTNKPKQNKKTGKYLILKAAARGVSMATQVVWDW
jgi:hypothetical protein